MFEKIKNTAALARLALTLRSIWHGAKEITPEKVKATLAALRDFFLGPPSDKKGTSGEGKPRRK